MTLEETDRLNNMRTGRLVTNSLRMKNGAVAITAALTMTEREHAFKTIVLNNATGFTTTLPPATGSGAVYRFVVTTTVTSGNMIIQCANATDEFHGFILICDSDTGDALTIDPALDGDGYDTITMNGSTKGGIMGDWFEITDYASGKFHLKGAFNGTGTVTSNLSAAV